MVRRMRLRPLAVYLILEFAAALAFSTIFTVNMVYQVTVAKLGALQLVLVGTILETTIFVFEVPTGVLADVKSRRLSIIIGYAVMGLGFIVEGALPFFASVALAQVLWGLGYTFTSGATQAWIADEVGPERAGQAFLRGAQAGRVGGLAAMPISIALGSLRVNLPILLGGGMMILLAIFLALTMTEEHFVPSPPGERTTWGVMFQTVRDAGRLMRRQPVLWVLLGIGWFYGLYSEGFDRLWTPHLLNNYCAPFMDRVQPVVWFGLIRATLIVMGLLANEVVRRRVDTARPRALGPVLMLNAGTIVLALAGFGLTRSFWVALGLYWLIQVLRGIAEPLREAWLNVCIDDSQVRATLFSVSSQVDAIGQIAGGPLVGAIGNRSLRAALVTSALILSPVLPLYALALRSGARDRVSGKGKGYASTEL